MIFPITTVVLPVFLFFRYLHLTNSLFGLVLIYAGTGLPLAIFIFTSFMKTVPYQISEAALLDDANHLQIYGRIIMPLMRSSIATTVILESLSVWNDFFLPLIFIDSKNLRPLPLMLYIFKGTHITNWPYICVLMVFMIIPIVIVYCLLQKSIISGVVEGAVKG
jgi:raffinose/stachyose/melibiose transport system permease protein